MKRLVGLLLLNALLLVCGSAWRLEVHLQAQPTVGVWTNITPAVVPQGGSGGNNCDYGTLSVVTNPQQPSTVYLGTCEHGILKSLDSGNSWVHVNTGANSDILDRTRQWTLAIDPVNPQVLYTNSGYGGEPNNGAWKTSDGGVNWTRIWPPPNNPTLVNIIQQNFVAQVFIDPTAHDHVFLSWHGRCAAPYTPVCYGESTDGGEHWTIRNGDTRWVESEAQTIYIIDANKWLFANHADGLWSTSNAGVTWSLVNANGAGHWPAQLYKSSTGAYYIGSDVGLFRSTNGVSWTLVYNGYLTNGLIGDGTRMFASNAGSLTPWVPPGTNPYVTALESDGLTWSTAPWVVPPGQFTQGAGAGMAIDVLQHYLYSSNGTVGLWRVKYAAGGEPPPPPPPPPSTCESAVRVDGVVKFVDAPSSICVGAHP